MVTGNHVKNHNYGRSDLKDAINRLRDSSKSPKNEDDLIAVILLISQLNSAISKENSSRLMADFSPTIIDLAEELWCFVTKHLDIKRRSIIRASVTNGMILRYKVVFLLAEFLGKLSPNKLQEIDIPKNLLVTKALAEFIGSQLEKQEKHPRSFSHLATKALVLLDRKHQYKMTVENLVNGIKQGAVHPSYRQTVSNYLDETE